MCFSYILMWIRMLSSYRGWKKECEHLRNGNISIYKSIKISASWRKESASHSSLQNCAKWFDNIQASSSTFWCSSCPGFMIMTLYVSHFSTGVCDKSFSTCSSFMDVDFEILCGWFSWKQGLQDKYWGLLLLCCGNIVLFRHSPS